MRTEPKNAKGSDDDPMLYNRKTTVYMNRNQPNMAKHKPTASTPSNPLTQYRQVVKFILCRRKYDALASGQNSTQ